MKPLPILLLSLLACVEAQAARAPKYQQPIPVKPPAVAPSEAKVATVFRGQKNFNEAQLRTAIADPLKTIVESGLSPATADDAAFFLGIFYKKNGYPDATVEESISGSTLVLNIHENQLTELGDVHFAGNKTFTEVELKDFIVGVTRERFSALKKQLPFVETDVKTGVANLRGMYQGAGFLDATLDDPVITFSGGKQKANVAVTVHEGTRYRFGALSFVGDVPFQRGDLVKELQKFTSQPYTPSQVTNMTRALGYYYKRHGYFQAAVDVASDPKQSADGAVPVTFTAKSGPVFHFGKTTARGTERLNPKFLPKRFAGLEGKTYDPNALDTVFRDMMRTGLFKRLRVSPKAGPDNTVNVELEAEEAPAKEVGFQAGFGTYEGPIVGITLGDRDLFGSGRPLTASFEYSPRYLRGEFLYSDPWFLEGPIAMELRLSGLSVSYDGYDKNEYALRNQYSYQLTKQWQVAAFIQGRQDTITSTGIDPIYLGITDYHVVSTGFTQTLDLRRDPLLPNGFVGSVTLEYATSALGSSIDYVRGTVRGAYYQTLGRGLLGLGGRAGVVSDTGSEALPIDERFFNGGSRSVRSFAERDLGPKDPNGHPIGGNSFSVFNAEYTYPVWGDLGVAFFVDAGSVGRSEGDIFSDLRYAVGLGLRYKLPIGPVRLDYGVNPSPHPDEDRGALHFSFGFAF